MTKTVTLDYQPQPRQALAHSVRARQILYGGAIGGGKSAFLRWDAIAFCLQNPGLDAYLFRRTLGELEDNHIRVIQREIPGELGEYRESKKRYEFFNGSGINFCYCEKLKDIYRYQGAEMHWVGIDEAGQLEPPQIAFLKTRNRLGSFKPAQEGLLPRFVMASNPGGPAHAYLKRRMIDPALPETMFFDDEMRDARNPDDRGWSSIYIPAKMSDNKYLDTDYAAALGALPPELQQAYRDGDWDVVVGAALHSLDKRRHQLRPFKPPRHWTKFMSMDWGSAKPFAVLWLTVSEGAWLDARGDWPKVYLPPGALIVYDEWYGWSGKENEGCRMESQAVAREILKREQERGEVMDYRVGDSQMWASSDGPSPEERMRLATDSRFVLMQAQKDRKINYGEILARLAGENIDLGDQVVKLPMLYITQNCRHGWRTLPGLVLDDNDPEKGPADEKKQEDHWYDSCAYSCRSRPYVTTVEERWEEENREIIKQARRVNADPYSTARR